MTLLKHFPVEAKKALSKSGVDVVSEIGDEIIKDVVLDVLVGENIRNSTELLTRKRLLTLNAASFITLLKMRAENQDVLLNLHDEVFKKLSKGRLPRTDKWILQWVLGLTDKAFQNVLRDDLKNLEIYKNEYRDVLVKSMEEFEKDYGKLSGKISYAGKEVDIDWDILTYLMTIVGSQTLAIRGSDKSTFGKLFEKLILGSLLSILGFKQVTPDNIGDGKKVFWLSERKEKRESDGTILIEKGKGVRFDIGFIGRGNPEISLDKVSRFERTLELNSTKYYMATIIIVDRIGANSRIETLAKNIDGHIVQMSGSYWPKKIAGILNSTMGYKDALLDSNSSDLHQLLKKRLSNVDFKELVKQGFDV